MSHVTADEAVDIHGWFGLSYANYLVLHRTLLQSMPVEWQHRMVRCLAELDEAFSHIERPEAYEVIPGRDRYLDELSPDQLKSIGYAIEIGEDETVYYDRNHNQLDPTDAACHHVLWPEPDPVPHYNRGRTHFEPQG